jgi:GNAT superfamily N-acetyltransferase
MIAVRSAHPALAPAQCEPVLRSIPEWFGIESATRAYISACGTLPTWIAEDGRGGVAGFLTIRRHFDHAAEIHCIAVHRSHHGTGVGTALLHHVEAELRAGGVRWLQVKTMGPSRPNPEYARTLRFYLSRGFQPLEEFSGMWDGIPALQLIKTL